MSEELSVHSRADQLIAGDELLPAARATLLLHLTRACLAPEPQRAEEYWAALKRVRSELPADEADTFDKVRARMEADSARPKGGFHRALRSKMRDATVLVHEDPDRAAELLDECEKRLEARAWPFGKKPLRVALLLAWDRLDRGRAIARLADLPARPAITRRTAIVGMQEFEPLDALEWEQVVGAVGVEQAARAACALLDPEGAPIVLPEPAFLATGRCIMREASRRTDLELLSRVSSALTLIRALYADHRGRILCTASEALAGEVVEWVAVTELLEKDWFHRLVLLMGCLNTFAEEDWFREEGFNRLVSNTPPRLRHFVRAHGSALLAPEMGIEETWEHLLQATGNDPVSEAWFLTVLAENGHGIEARKLAARRPGTKALQASLERAMLITEGRGSVNAEALAGDQAAEFLLNSEAMDRARWLRRHTLRGELLPAETIWCELRPKKPGFLQSLFTEIHDPNAVAVECVRRNHLSGVYRCDVRAEVQFEEFLRIQGYGEFSDKHLDPLLLEALTLWGNAEPTEVRSLLAKMWAEIEPETILVFSQCTFRKLLERCATVFAADPEFFSKFLRWLSLNIAGQTHKAGNVSLEIPASLTMLTALVGAKNVGGFSPERRDQIILDSVNTLRVNSTLVSLAAAAYSMDKPPLQIGCPVKLKWGRKRYLDAWQVGVVRAASARIAELI